MQRTRSFFRAAPAAALIALAAACGGDADAADKGGPGGPGGGRNAGVNLSPANVASPRRAPMEDAVAHAIEQGPLLSLGVEERFLLLGEQLDGELLLGFMPLLAEATLPPD